MNFKFLFSAIFSFLCFNLWSQTDTSKNIIQFDTIKFVNGSRQAAKIYEISDKYIKYKNPLDLDGPMFLIRKKDVEGFILKDGCVDLKQQGFVNCVKDPTYGLIEERNFKRKMISLDLYQLANKHLQLNIDYIFRNKKNGLGVFVNRGLLDENGIATFDKWETRIGLLGKYYKKNYCGIDYKIFPTAHKKITYFLSLGFDIGQAYFQRDEIVPGYLFYHYNNYYGSWRYDYIPQSIKKVIYDAVYTGYRFNNGFILRMNKHFFCQGSLTLGVNYYTYQENDTRINSVLPKISAGVLLGYAF